MKEKLKTLPWRLILEIAMGLGLLVLGGILLFRPAAAAPQAAAPSAQEGAAEGDSSLLTLFFHGPEDTMERQLAPGQLLVPEPAELEGYTFLRWQDGAGRPLPAEGAIVWESGDYYPVFAMKLGRADHAPYLPLDSRGAFHPSFSLTRREVVCILYSLLDTELVGDGRFLDVPEDDPAYNAAATLKTLGAVSGSRLHPDEPITRREFLSMLCSFFPETGQDFTFADLDEKDEDYRLFCTAAAQGWIESGAKAQARPDELLTRLELAVILNTATDRHGDCKHRIEMVGTILDMDRTDPRYWDVAEASIVHTFKGEGEEESWISSEGLPLREPGYFFLDLELHAIGEDGNPVVDAVYDGLYFDINGIESSGSPELDEKIRAILKDQVNPDTMSGEQMLRKLYFYTYNKFTYRGGKYFPVGEPAGWEADVALDMVVHRKGNCYSFAALFCELARAVGYDAKAITGGVIGGGEIPVMLHRDIYGNPLTLPLGRVPHGWVEIELDGKVYIFDPEYEYSYHFQNRNHSDYDFFMMGEEGRERYGYYKDGDPWVGPTPAPTPEPTPTPSPKPSPSPSPSPSPKPKG